MKTAKRFWKHALAVPVEGGFGIELDTRPVRTPAKTALILPTIGLAELVASEWDAQVDRVNPETMPATRMANAAIDKVSTQFGDVAAMIAAYGDSDLLCYRATAPVELVVLQAKKWNPLLDWAADEMGARLQIVSGIMHVPQDRRALGILESLVSAHTPYELAAFHDLVAISGSLILGFAAAKRLLVLDDLWELACLDEIWQEQQWGRDDDAAALRERKRNDFFDAAHFFGLCR